jgi:transcriptional regulator with XRE-family HTH domain
MGGEDEKTPAGREWGQNLRAARESQGLTQVRLSDLIGVWQSSIARWEAGERCPCDAHKIALAAALNEDGWVVLSSTEE